MKATLEKHLLQERFDEEGQERPLWKRLPLPVLILLAGVFLTVLLVTFKPVPPKTTPQKTAALVRVIHAESKTERILVSGFGTVEAQRELEVRPQVSGHVVEINKKLQVGGRIDAGEVMFRIDPRDYEIGVESRQAELARSEFDVQLEKGNRVVAEREWKLLEEGMEVSDLGKKLALREPHMREKKAALKAAQSRLQKAKLDLERTVIKSPFNSVVLEEMVEVGTFLGSTAQSAKIAATDEFYVQVRIPQNSLSWLQFEDEGNDNASVVRVIQQPGSGSEAIRSGRLVRLLGDVDRSGRMARVLIAVPSPLESENGEPPLLLGSYVKVEIEGLEVENLIRLPRAAVREGNRVWIVDDNNTLDFKKAQVVFSRNDEVYIKGDLREDELVVVSPISVPLKGMLLEPTNGVKSSADAQPME